MYLNRSICLIKVRERPELGAGALTRGNYRQRRPKAGGWEESHASPRAWSDTLITWANLSCSERVPGAAPWILSRLLHEFHHCCSTRFVAAPPHVFPALGSSRRIYLTTTQSNLLQVHQAPKQIYDNYYPVSIWFDAVISHQNYVAHEWCVCTLFPLNSRFFGVGRHLKDFNPKSLLWAGNLSTRPGSELRILFLETLFGQKSLKNIPENNTSF